MSAGRPGIRSHPTPLPGATTGRPAPTSSPGRHVRCACAICGAHTVAIVDDVPSGFCRTCGSTELAPVAGSDR